MTYHQKLDKILIALSKLDGSHYEAPKHLKTQLDNDISESDTTMLLEHLVGLGLAKVSKSKELFLGSTLDAIYYKITLNGFLFIERTSFAKEIEKEKRLKYWTITKTAVAALNGVFIIAIGIASVFISYQSNEEHKENKLLRNRLDSLTIANKSKIKINDSTISKHTIK